MKWVRTNTGTVEQKYINVISNTCIWILGPPSLNHQTTPASGSIDFTHIWIYGLVHFLTNLLSSLASSFRKDSMDVACSGFQDALNCKYLEAKVDNKYTHLLRLMVLRLDGRKLKSSNSLLERCTTERYEAQSINLLENHMLTPPRLDNT